jgi:hypothetical protein
MAWEGSSGWAEFDDPLNPGGADKRGTYGYGLGDFDIAITRASSEAFRLTLFGSAGTHLGGIHNRVTVSSGTGSAEGTYNITSGQRWYMYFDIGAGNAPIRVSMEYLGGDARGLTGMAFDLVPPQGTVISIR